MTIIWRDDVRFTRWTEDDGIRYAVPSADDSPLPRSIIRSARRNSPRSVWIDGRLRGLAERNKERRLKRLLERFDDAVRLPSDAPIRRQLIYQ